MSSDSGARVTRLLCRARDGDEEAAGELFALLYDELHGLARRHMRNQRLNHTLGASALVHEAYLKLWTGDGHDWKSRGHFLALASRAMRSILVDHARGKQRDKRDPGGARLELDELAEAYEYRSRGLVALDDALERMAAFDERSVRLVDLRFFGGLTMEEAAEALGMSRRQAYRDWMAARAWLRSELR